MLNHSVVRGSLALYQCLEDFLITLQRSASSVREVRSNRTAPELSHPLGRTGSCSPRQHACQVKFKEGRYFVNVDIDIMKTGMARVSTAKPSDHQRTWFMIVAFPRAH